MARTRLTVSALALALVGVLLLSALPRASDDTVDAADQPRTQAAAAQAATPPASSAQKRKPNIVFILTDDLSTNLVPYMSAVRALKRKGTTFRNHYAADSLCCPSRSNILTGRYPHNTKVRVNENDRGGGYRAFVRHGNQKRTYATALDRAGYRTGFLGKYLNGYKIRKHKVPRGWDEWHASSNGYSNMAKTYGISGVTKKGGRKNIRRPNRYMNDTLGRRARAFVNRANNKKQPFFLQLSSFAPHQRLKGDGPLFPPAQRDRRGKRYANGDCGAKPGGGRYNCAKLKVPRSGDFSESTYRKLDGQFRSRVRMMQSLNDQILKLRHRLARNGQLSRTYFVFSSDNGFHLGEHGLLRGKGTAYDHDTRAPLVVSGPGVPQGKVRKQITQTVDFYPTFQQFAGLKPKPNNGHGLHGMLGGKHGPKGWREAALYEHTAQQKKQKRAAQGDSDPDLDGDAPATRRAGFIPSYHTYSGIRTRKWLYVNYADGSRPELYNLTKDPGQHRNVHGNRPGQVKRLRGWLQKYRTCGKPHTATCWKASNR